MKKSWWVDFNFNHRRYRKRSPANTRAGALAYEATLRTRLAKGEPIDEMQVVSEQTFAEFSGKWLDEYAAANNKPAERKAKAYILSSSLVPFFGKMLLGRITSYEIERYKAWEKQRGLSNKTINNKLAVLRKCLGTASDWDCLATEPPRIKSLKAVPPQMDYLSRHECETLLGAARGMIFEIILTALRTGMRQGELRGLQWESIDWQNHQIVVRHSLCDYVKELTSTKSNRERIVPLADDIYRLLYARRNPTGYVFTKVDEQPFRGNHLLNCLNRVTKTAGLRKIGWHTLRHTFASHLAMNGVSMRVVQELLGHASLSMTMRYSHVASENLREAVNGLVRGYQISKFGQPAVNL